MALNRILPSGSCFDLTTVRLKKTQLIESTLIISSLMTWEIRLMGMVEGEGLKCVSKERLQILVQFFQSVSSEEIKHLKEVVWL